VGNTKAIKVQFTVTIKPVREMSPPYLGVPILELPSYRPPKEYRVISTTGVPMIVTSRFSYRYCYYCLLTIWKGQVR